jgi:hypothetical protein
MKILFAVPVVLPLFLGCQTSNRAGISLSETPSAKQPSNDKLVSVPASIASVLYSESIRANFQNEENLSYGGAIFECHSGNGIDPATSTCKIFHKDLLPDYAAHFGTKNSHEFGRGGFGHSAFEWLVSISAEETGTEAPGARYRQAYLLSCRRIVNSNDGECTLSLTKSVAGQTIEVPSKWSTKIWQEAVAANFQNEENLSYGGELMTCNSGNGFDPATATCTIFFKDLPNDLTAHASDKNTREFGRGGLGHELYMWMVEIKAETVSSNAPGAQVRQLRKLECLRIVNSNDGKCTTSLSAD